MITITTTTTTTTYKNKEKKISTMTENIIGHSNANNTTNKRKKKLSKWMKRIIQPARDIQTQTQTQTQTQPRIHHKETKVQWDQEPQRKKTNQDLKKIDTHIPNYKYIDSEEDDEEDSEDSDHASMAPLFSFCSSSVKSSTFSDMHSMQSTRPTVMSTRTVETNSSTMAIPPASILDRARVGTTSLGHTSATPSIISSKPSSSRHFSLQRHNSSHTVNSIVTIKS